MFLPGKALDYFFPATIAWSSRLRCCCHLRIRMRVDDINVVADLNRHDSNAQNPDEPVVYDGTTSSQTPESRMMVEDFFASIQNAIEVY